jgi:hypothetical protein
MKLSPEILEKFDYWILEREKIRVLKESDVPAPWTDDWILNNHHFCNVNRQSDRGTKEIQKVIHNNVDELLLLPCAYTMARMFNYAPTVKYVIQNWDLQAGPEEDADFAEFLKRKFDKLFHTAYVVSTCGQSMCKVEYVLGTAKKVLEAPVSNYSCDDAYKTILKINGMGTFLSAQVIADLKNDRFLVDAPDWMTFCTMGPGSKKGLNYLYGGGTTHSNFHERIDGLKNSIPEDTVALVKSMQDFQNCLCEFSKYMRYLNNEKGRRRYYVR